ncbi:MAG TPA: FtsX-like permease family protein [Cyclobacteriaceae bacterium]|nr:FtsX-like permease family protein [Cyclobacteriaceae bacterium]
MLRNYIIIGVRNLLKNKLFSFINISGMAISAACFLIITLFVIDELSYDQYVEDVSLKYRVYNEFFSDDGGTRVGSMVPPMVAPTLKSDYPEVDYHFRFLNVNSKLLFQVGDVKSTEEGGGYGESTMFDLFSLRLVEGDRQTILTQPNTIALSQSLAKKYFGDKPALGQTIRIGTEDTQVSGVYEDFPAHSHLHLNYLLRLDDLAQELGERMQSWQWNQFHTYIKLKPGSDGHALESKLKDFAERHAWPVTKQNGGYYIPHIMPLEDVHLKASNQLWDIADRGNAQTVYILSATALFILIIAILNFVNLSTSRAMNRMKEVGVRKSIGAMRTQLVKQFMSESVIVAVISLLIGILIVQLTLPSLNSFTEKQIPLDVFLSPVTIGGILLFALIIGLAAGAYPALYISSFKPSAILAGKQSAASGKTVLRKGLVVIQFILSFFMIVAALVVSDQLTYMQTKDMGFQKDNVIVLPLRGGMYQKKDAVKNEFINHPNIISGSLGYGLPGQAFAGDGFTDIETSKEWQINMLTVDQDYTKTLGLTIVAGRDFSKEFPADEQNAFIISEAGAKMLGHTDPKDAIGHKVSWQRWDDGKKKEGSIIGVVKDIHLNSLHQSMTPVMLQNVPFVYNTLSLRVKGEDLPATIAHLEDTWKKLESDWPFEYKFLDSNFDKLYKSETRLAKLFTFFTGFAIFVACLGLFGLVVYNTSQRFKEISIRKVFGAKESQLVVQLGKTYFFLICIAFVVAVPISYYAADTWLQTFPYRTEVTIGLFIKAAVGVLTISMITVGIQSLKAARTNPVNALKEQ